jgi:hypothetical protein
VPVLVSRIPLIATALLAIAPLASAAPQASFDWSAPARFLVPALGDDASPYEVYAESLHPESWPIDFDACASGEDVVEYRWTIEGTPAGSESQCDGFSWSFPAEGPYGVSLTVVDGEGAEATTHRTVVVQDLLLFGLGDSYGSGEGAPDEPVPEEAITLANAAQAALDAAQAARDAARAAYLAELSQYQITVAQLDAVLAALVRYQNAKAAVAANCPLPVIACGQATAELTAATAALLLELGRAGLAGLDIDRPATILDAVADLRALADAALGLAQASWNAAEAALAAAQDELAAARAQLVAGWQSRSCHRTAQAAQVQAARLLEERDPRTSVTFVHLACSGATIPKGILGPYVGIEPIAPRIRRSSTSWRRWPPSIPRSRRSGLRRPVDGILLSIGGNDVNFAGIIEKCITYASCPDAPVLDATALAARTAYCSSAPPWARADCFAELAPPDFDTGLDAETLFREGVPDTNNGVPGLPDNNGLDNLSARYAVLHQRLGDAGLADAPVYLTQYPDITRDENGDLCGWQILDDLATRQRNLLGITPDEMGWAAQEVAPVLSDVMEMSAGSLDWRFVAGAAADFGRHGYCSLDNWIVRLQESFAIQAQPWGVVHPNEAGHAAWAQRIAAAVAVPEPGAGAGAAALAALALLADGGDAWAAARRPVTESSLGPGS